MGTTSRLWRWPRRVRWATLASVLRLCILVGTTLGGYAGWWLGDALGPGLAGAFLLSGAGSLAGVYADRKAGRRLDA